MSVARGKSTRCSKGQQAAPCLYSRSCGLRREIPEGTTQKECSCSAPERVRGVSETVVAQRCSVCLRMRMCLKPACPDNALSEERARGPAQEGAGRGWGPLIRSSAVLGWLGGGGSALRAACAAVVHFCSGEGVAEGAPWLALTGAGGWLFTPVSSCSGGRLQCAGEPSPSCAPPRCVRYADDRSIGEPSAPRGPLSPDSALLGAAETHTKRSFSRSVSLDQWCLAVSPEIVHLIQYSCYA